ncbi:MAG: glycogen/starch/alpha-glucan phosphorylase, partial [Clostridia bacterium]|nr:glycogen/starch/alpha-glucan phosphorylase [Clostridia bacterium]
FRQKIVDGEQVEMPDNWLADGCAWEVPHNEEQYEINFYGNVVEYYDEAGRMCFKTENTKKVLAVPYDIPVCGGDGGIVNTLRIWSARSPVYFDMSFFGQGDYIRASQEREMAETISRVLYPNDSHNTGKSLRLRQQYFFTSATLQYMLARHKKLGRDLHDLPDYAAVQINDTHPAIAIAELMRLLVDEESFGWDEAWDICQRVFSYTNHTIMWEALEKWPDYLMINLLPRIYQIICEIDRRAREKARTIYPYDEETVNRMAPIAYGQVNMANLCLSCCHKVNGVSGLHTEILRNSLFKSFQPLNPEQLVNVTNGVTPRRWLLQANPLLSRVITKTLGSAAWVNDLPRLAALEKKAEDSAFVKEFMAVKRANKQRLAEYVRRTAGIDVNPDSLFDIHVKRLHEYKRQMLNVMKILYLYFDIKENHNSHVPATFFFGAKAAPGYVRAKQIIMLIHSLADRINNDPDVNEILKVVFIENYCVSSAQVLIPAADISEQISMAGKEASGTGNMKFMMNGALTLGTLDGANVEMHDMLGDDNMMLFGLRAQEAESLSRPGAHKPMDLYRQNRMLARVVDAFADGTLRPEVASIKNYLLDGDGGASDPYLCMADFASYIEAYEALERLWRDPQAWGKKAIINTARSHYFSSDRSIKEYNETIWNLSQV